MMNYNISEFQPLRVDKAEREREREREGENGVANQNEDGLLLHPDVVSEQVEENRHD